MPTNYAIRMRANTTPNTATDCLEWNKCRLPNGYGRTRYLGKNILAHRLAWVLAYPEDERLILDNPRQLVCHTCDNPPCCNVAHLFLGTQKINVMDMMRKGRMNIEPAQAAARFQRIRKFSHDQIDAIRSAPGLLREVAAKFGCSSVYVSQLRRGKRKTAIRRS